MALDQDFEMEELMRTGTNIGNSSETRVSLRNVSACPPSRSSFAESKEDDPDDYEEGRELRRASPNPSTWDGGTAEVLRCSSNSSFRPSSSLLRAKTRSRLMDPPPGPGGRAEERKSIRITNRSGQTPLLSGQIPRSSPLKSELLSKSAVIEEDEDDPFEDLPDDFKRTKLGICTILQLITLVLIVAALVCSLSIPRLERQTLWGLQSWKWAVLVLVLFSGRLLSGWFIRIIVFFLERNFNFRKRFLYFVYGVRNAVLNCIWLGQVLTAWQLLFDKQAERENKMLSYITRIIFCLIVATALRLVKTLFVKVLASSFHVSTYFDRIQEALFNQYIIETLSGPPLIEIQHIMEEEERTIAEVQKFQNAGAAIPNDLRATAMSSRIGRVIGGSGDNGQRWTGLRSQAGNSTKLSGAFSRKDSGKKQLQQKDGISIDELHKLNQKNVSAWKMKRLMRIVRRGMLTTLDEQIANQHGEDESALLIRSEHEAKLAARKIFNNVSKPGERHIYLADLMRFMREDEARRALNLFSGAQGDGKVSRRSLKDWVVNVFRERRALSLTLNDTKTAVNKLHQMANAVVAIIVIIIWLLILNISTTHFFVFLSSQVLALVFVFGNTLKSIFEAIIFLFVVHPYDVGDRCEVNGVQMVVEEMNILTTIFLRYDFQKITYPNCELAKLPIGNFYRSPDMGDSIDFSIHVSTPVEKIAVMRERITACVEANKDHWYPGAQVVIKDVQDMNSFNVSLWMRHRINFQDMGMKWTRREPLVQEMVRILKELDIEYRMLPMDVNIRNMPPVTSNRLPSNWKTCS
ncbi:hypothetical protein HPP92_020714 [Vanilla planifolia]|uniref:Mechanosensitive ion channel protein n=1 Tax=Vanilla planifolia TaxID=51239 RepID=A0A835UG55_VANPL|nr:hypothetical protein HPP92_020714 [Vanilla planifolia]